MMNKKVVGALFDDGAQSVKNSLDQEKYEVYCYGRFDKPDHHNINVNLAAIDKKFGTKQPKPDIIVASPPCQAFSMADKGTQFIKHIYYTTIESRSETWYDIHNEYCPKNKIRSFYQKVDSFANGIGCLNTTFYLINTYEPASGYIENPATSMLGEWRKRYRLKGKINRVRYNNYDESFPQKNTIFNSSHALHLNNRKITTDHKGVDGIDRKSRSSIPTKLIKLIFERMDK